MQTYTIKYDSIPDEVYLNMLLYLIHSEFWCISVDWLAPTWVQ